MHSLKLWIIAKLSRTRQIQSKILFEFYFLKKNPENGLSLFMVHLSNDKEIIVFLLL